MNLRFTSCHLSLLVMTYSSDAFSLNTASIVPLRSSSTQIFGIADESIESEIDRAIGYVPGAADTPFAKRYAHLKGAKVKTVGEAFATFTSSLGTSVNALYKNMMTDIVGTTHLSVVNARFVRDPIWSLGIVTALDLLLKNYPEVDDRSRIITSLFKSVDLVEDEIQAESKSVKEWMSADGGKTKDDVLKALKGEIESPFQSFVNNAKEDEYWMYSRFFGIGLIAMMDNVGVEMSADAVYPVLEDWMENGMGKSHFTACSDSDTYFKIKTRLDMMETMMKEIEIREKKKMAQRLEDKAEAAIRKAERDVEMQKEIAKEAAKEESAFE